MAHYICIVYESYNASVSIMCLSQHGHKLSCIPGTVCNLDIIMHYCDVRFVNKSLFVSPSSAGAYAVDFKCQIKFSHRRRYLIKKKRKTGS